VTLFRSRASLLPDPAEPIRSELFSVERLEQHAESLAAAQSVTPDRRGGRPLLPRLKDNARALLTCYRTIAQAIREERTIPPAAEWLVDNFHIVDDQIRQIPASFSAPTRLHPGRRRAGAPTEPDRARDGQVRLLES